MRLLTAIVGLIGALLLLTGCDVTPGGACSAEGSKTTNKNGYSYTCRTMIKPDGTAGKKIWMQDAPLTPDRP